MMYKTMRYGSLRGLRGAFDLNATVVPADSSFVASTPTSKPVMAASNTYTMVAPLLTASPAPLTVLKASTVTTIDEGTSDAPAGSDMFGPSGGSMTVPGVEFGDFDTPVVADSTATSTASDDVAEAHEASLDPVVSEDPADLPSADNYGVSLYNQPAPQQQRPATSSGWLWALGAAAVVGGVGFFLFRRR